MFRSACERPFWVDYQTEISNATLRVTAVTRRVARASFSTTQSADLTTSILS